ncbi:DUF6414 family protein [Rhodococcus opacus]|uniref:Uncharacterized protein n=1 Tax=Rhodococcus opacus (strain B4) TaxID=632772 RepID=C1BCM5_RHOOB|nr:hypothetical protein [Rhodococcus opacus]BAH56080.1 hypothetical protein ROP_pROB01-05810 [Rhodococcus opacus B4]
MTDSEIAPYVAVYQNTDFIGGLTQSATNSGISLSGESEYTEGVEHGDQRGRGGKTHLTARAAMPGLGEAGLDVGGNLDKATTDKNTSATRHRLSVSYDMAFHLHRLHELLEQHTTTVATPDDAEPLETGAIVKFTGKFNPDPISAILDIASPDLISEVARFAARTRRPAVDGETFNVDELKYKWELAEQNATTQADFARAITTALHTDFRRSTTIEFHCAIASGLTAIVVCETEHFTTADPDRLLDGEFTVLGKVVTSPETDIPVLRKNKFLRRLDTDWVRWLFHSLGSSVDRLNDAEVTAFVRDHLNRNEAAAPPLDLHFPAVIEGRSFTVLPIGIYA